MKNLNLPSVWQQRCIDTHTFIWHNPQVKAGTVLENSKWKIKVYSPPREHGTPHVHIISKGDNAEVKIYLETLEVAGKTKFSKKAVKEIIKYLHKNYDFLMDKWEAIHGKKKKT